MALPTVAHSQQAINKKTPHSQGAGRISRVVLSQNLGSLHDFDDLGESFRIGDGHISKNLAVHLDTSLGKLVNELAVADAVFTDSGIEMLLLPLL